MDPRFSIILAVRNAAHLLPAALAALQRQTFKDFEIVVVDGESTDGTLELLSEAARLLPIKLVSERDNGISDAYAKGFRRAIGDLVIASSADERLEPEALEIANRWFEETPEAIVCCGRTDLINAAGSVMRGYTNTRFDLTSHLSCEVVLPISASVFNRTILGSELRLDITRPTCPDYELWGRLAFSYPRDTFRLFDVRIATALATRDSMSFRTEAFAHFVRDKAAYLDHLLERFVAGPDRDRLRRRSVAGIHMWAAEQLHLLDPKHPDILERCAQAWNSDPNFRWIGEFLERTSLGAIDVRRGVIFHSGGAHGKIEYDPRQTLPYLSDLFVGAPKDIVIAWIGARPGALEMFADTWRRLGFAQPIYVAGSSIVCAPIPGTTVVDVADIVEHASAFIFDFGSPEHDHVPVKASEVESIQQLFFKVIRAERARLVAQAVSRRIVCLAPENPSFEALIRHLESETVSYDSFMRPLLRCGYARPAVVERQDWISDLRVGEAGTRRDLSICAKGDSTGVVCYGPYRPLHPGGYRFEMRISGEAPSASLTPIALLELKWGQRSLDFTPIRMSDLKAGRVATDLHVGDRLDLSDSLEAVVHALVPANFCINSLACEPVVGGSRSSGKLSKGADWLDLLSIGPAGRRRADNKVDVKASDEFAVFGPYWALPGGRYECRIGASAAIADETPFLTLEVFSNGRYRAVTAISAAAARAGRAAAEFEVHDDETSTGALPVELRIRAEGLEGVLDSAIVRRIGDARLASPWVTFPDMPAGQQSGGLAGTDASSGPLSIRIGGRTIRSILAGVKRRAVRVLGAEGDS